MFFTLVLSVDRQVDHLNFEEYQRRRGEGAGLLVSAAAEEQRAIERVTDWRSEGANV